MEKTKPARLSERGKNVPKSAIRKLIPLSKETEKRGIKVHKLNIGQPDVETPDEYWQAVRNFKERTLAYAPSEGRPEFLASLVEYYRRYGIVVTADDMVVIQGGIEGVFFAILAVTDFGDEIIVAEPYYSNYIGCTAMAGVAFRSFTTTAETGYHLPPRDVIEKLVTPRTRAILVATPGNPTGCVYTRDEMAMLADIAKSHGLFLLSDEVYREFAYDGGVPVSVMQLPGMEQHGVIIDSVSKRYSACGARLGCLVSKNREFISAARAYATIRLSAATLDQIGIAACIRTPGAYFERVRADYVERRDIVVDAMNRVPDTVCPVPGGAFYAMVKIKGVNTEDFAKWLLTDFSYEGETVMIAPGAGFYATPGLGRDEIRIAYVWKADIMRRAMDVLSRGIVEYRKT
ncbi:MAG: pyridoxal phosphate-dependent aminotransferase [Fibrobacterota bacterium]